MNTLSYRSIFRAPAMRALAIQCLALLLLLFALRIFAMVGVNVGATVAVLLQGSIAAGISIWRGLAWWWCPIQLFFPIVLLTTLSLNLPPSIFLVVFIFLLGLYWTTFRTQVPFYPSSPKVWDSVLELLPNDRPIRFVDIGSGLGGLVLNLALRKPESTFVGIELAPLPWLVSQVRKKMAGSRAHFIRGDYEDQHLAHYDVVFAYLSPAAMVALWNKAKTEMRSGTLLLSYEFPVVGNASQITILDKSGGPALYGWHF